VRRHKTYSYVLAKVWGVALNPPWPDVAHDLSMLDALLKATIAFRRLIGFVNAASWSYETFGDSGFRG